MQTITRYIEFDMAHRLPNHKGRCSSVHGHRWKIGLTVEGEPESKDSSEGMVVDYKDLKSWLNEIVDEKFDHAITLYYKDPYVVDFLEMYNTGWGSIQGKKTWEILSETEGLELVNIHDEQHRFNLVNFIPTSENLAQYFLYEVKQRFNTLVKDIPANENFKVKSIELWETPNCRCIAE